MVDDSDQPQFPPITRRQRTALIFAGVPSLFGSPVLAVPFLLDLMKLPHDMFQLFLSVDVITSRFGTLLGAMHYATIGLVGTTAMLGNLRFRWFNMARLTMVCVALIVPILFGVRAVSWVGN